MSEFRVVYVGCSMSGRRTSIADVLTRSGTPTDPLTISAESSFRLPFVDEGVLIDLSISLSAERSRLFYEDPTSPLLNPNVQREISRLHDADGLVFVVDGQLARFETNLDEFEKLQRDLRSRGVDIDEKPIVFQINKRDIDASVSIEHISNFFKVVRCSYVESIATEGVGTIETLSLLISLMQKCRVLAPR